MKQKFSEDFLKNLKVQGPLQSVLKEEPNQAKDFQNKDKEWDDQPWLDYLWIACQKLWRRLYDQ